MRLKRRFFPVLYLLICLAIISYLAPNAWAKPKYKVLAVIPGGLSGGLTFDSKGNLYGATHGGGVNGVGSIFEMTRDSNGKWTVTTLYSLDFKPDGEEPNGDLIFDAAGNLYGTTPHGGAYDSGTIFELSPGSSGWSFTVLYAFCEQYGCPDGGAPYSGLATDGSGDLLGTAPGGLYNLGVVFELTPGSSGWTCSILYSFGSRPHDGSDPEARLILDAAGNLYGTTGEGGRYGYGDGTVFRLTPASGGGWKERLLWQFDGSGGGGPEAPVTLDSAGNIYGTTHGGGGTCDGDLCGTLFKLTRRPGGRWAHSLVYGFLKPQDGFDPSSGVVFDKAGNLYGTTALGGVGQCYDGCGVAYKLSPVAHGKWRYAVIHKFEGTNPGGSVILDSKGNLYGTAYDVIYEITP